MHMLKNDSSTPRFRLRKWSLVLPFLLVFFVASRVPFPWRAQTEATGAAIGALQTEASVLESQRLESQ